MNSLSTLLNAAFSVYIVFSILKRITNHYVTFRHIYDFSASIIVTHQVGEIQELTELNEWFYVHTQNNPVNLISRGCYAKDFVERSSGGVLHGLSRIHQNNQKVILKRTRKLKMCQKNLKWCQK